MTGGETSGLLLDYTQDKVAVLDERGRFTYANEAARRILGFAPSELVGENAFEYVHPDDVEEVRRAFHDVVRSEDFTEGTVEYRHRASDGSWVWLESRMSNLTDSALDGFVVSSRDVTDRVEAERSQRETAARLEEIAAVSGDVLWMFDADWSELLFVNPAYEDVYGMGIDELRGDPSAFLEAIHPGDVPAVEEAMDCLSSGNSVDMEYRVNPAEDYRRWVWVQGEPIVEDGEVVRITGFTRDVTDRRRRERQLFVMDNLLRHNLRNELNVVLGMADLIEEEVPETAEYTTVIRETGEDLLRSAEKEREIIDLVTERPDRKRIELKVVLEDAVETVRDRYPDAHIETSGLEPIAVRGRPELRVAAIELLENAIRHAEDDRPTVRLALRRTGAHAEVVVEDESTPIPPIETNVLTGDHDMTEVYHSSGLGFWLIYWAVELSNGDVTVHSEEDRGNRITVSLPLEEPRDYGTTCSPSSS